MNNLSFLLICIVIIVPYVVASNWNPYEVLDVGRDASLEQIKKAYRDSAKKLHPDKSELSERDASQRFIELNKAFNILKDREKRSRFDEFGETEDIKHRDHYSNRFQHQNRQAKQHHVHDGYRTYTFFKSEHTFLKKQAISAKQYYSEYIEKSKRKLFFIFFYSDFCPSCTLIEPTWQKITEELAKFNVGSFSINVYAESRIAQDLGISSIPHIACLVDGEFHVYYHSDISMSSVVNFIKNSLPKNLIITLENEHEQDRFINLGIQTNRLGAVIFGRSKNLKIRYQLLAFELREYYRFGHISTSSCEYLSFINSYNVTSKSASQILVFDEFTKQPVLHLDIDEDSSDVSALKRQLLKWPFLKLPRLSSQSRFDDLCAYSMQRDGDRFRKRACTILFSSSAPSSLLARNKMVEFIRLNNLEHDDKVVFVYLDPVKQIGFVRKLLSETFESQPKFIKESINLSVMLVERQNNQKAKFKWIHNRWNPKNIDELDNAKIELHQLISDYKRSTETLVHKMVVGTLVDENGPNLLSRVLWRLVDSISSLFHYMTSQESFLTIAILMTCACVTSLILYKPSIESELPDTYKKANEACVNVSYTPNNDARDNPDKDDSLKIIELKAQTYNGMVRSLKPGFRTIILLTDEEAKNKLLPHFRKAIWPYRRNKTLLFGYLCLDKNFDWYRSVLEHILDVDNLKVIKKNCIGTVLSLNGFKKYLRVYHAKHHEIDYYNDETDDDGSFLGFENDGSDFEGAMSEGLRNCEYTVDTLLEKLPLWLDKMFDGLTKRYFINDWPEDMQ